MRVAGLCVVNKRAAGARLIAWVVGVLGASLVILGPLAAGRAHAGEAVLFAPVPDWVEPVSIPARESVDAAKAKGGKLFLLSDRQVYIENDQTTHFTRFAETVLSGSGLDSVARLEYSFDPAVTDFSVHTITVYRDGEVYNRIEPDLFQIIRREENFEDGILDGELTALAELRDIQVGDIVETAVSWRTRFPLWPGGYFRRFSTEWSVPTGRQHVRISIDDDRPLAVRDYGGAPLPEISVADGRRVYVWLRDNPPLGEFEPQTPNEYPLWAYVFVSTLESWADVIALERSAYEERAILPDGFADAHPWLTDETMPLNMRITRAIRFVQDDLRYAGDEVGLGGYIPRTPEMTLARRWGDCKDKALFLTVLLRAMGVEAYPVLTDLDNGYAIGSALPSPNAFDHAITVILIDGERYWIDPTASNRGGVFPNIVQADYGYGLPLKEGVDGPWPMVPAPLEEPDLIVREIYDFADYLTTGVSVRVETEHNGRAADGMRKTLEKTGIENLSDDYLEYYTEDMPGLERAAAMRVDDQRDDNVIRVIESYALSKEVAEKNGLYDEFGFNAYSVSGVLKDVTIDGRKGPVLLRYPYFTRHVIRLENLGKTGGVNETVKLADKVMSYRRQSSFQDNGLEELFELRTLARIAPADELAVYDKVRRDIEEWDGFTYDIHHFKRKRETDRLFSVILWSIIGFVVVFWNWQVSRRKKRQAGAEANP